MHPPSRHLILEPTESPESESPVLPPDEIAEAIEREKVEGLFRDLFGYAMARIERCFNVTDPNGRVVAAKSAHDVVMDAFEKVLTGARRVPRGVPVRNVLFGIVKSDVSHLASSKERKCFVDLMPIGDPHDEDPPPREVAESSEDPALKSVREEHERHAGEVLLAFIDEIKDDPQLVRLFECLLDGDPTRAEVGKRLGISPDAVTNLQKRLDRAMRAFGQKNPGLNPFRNTR